MFSPSASSPEPGLLRSRGPRRSSAACQRCRKRKQKCDGVQPACGQCVASGIPCQPSRRVVLQGTSCCECDILRAEIHTLKQEITALKSQESDVSVKYSDRSDGACENTPNVSPGVTQTPDVPWLGQSPKSSQPAACPVNSMRVLQPTFRRSTSRRTVDLSCPWHLWDGLFGDAPDDVLCSETRPSTDNAAELINHFFTRRWPQYPILHRPTFMTTHYLPFSGSNEANDLSSFLVYMVLAIGACEDPTTHLTVPQHLRYFRAAVHYLPGAFEYDDVDIVTCLMLLCMYGVKEPQLVDLWYTIGVALRLAIGADLHCCEAVGDNDTLESEMRRRLFWSLYAMDRTVSIALGRPLGINDADITVQLPANLPEEASTSNNGNDISAFLHILEMRMLKSEIYSAMHMPSGAELVDLDLVRSDFQARLDKWLANCPRNPSPASMHQTQEWLQVAYHQSMLMIYRPSRVSPCPGAADAALSRCVDSSIGLISCYAALYARNGVTYTLFSIVSIFMAAVTMLYALRADPVLRNELSRDVVDFNLRTCATLLRRISGNRVGERSAGIIERLGGRVLGAFDGRRPSSLGAREDSAVDAEFTSWFGVQRLTHSSIGGENFSSSLDTMLNGIFGQGFELSGAPDSALFGETWTQLDRVL